MNNFRIQINKYEVEKAMIATGMFLMEMTGIVFLVCGIFDIRII